MSANLPNRDMSKPATEQGLFCKFEVRRTDGSDEPGGKHHDCEYFVLDLDHDPFAAPALSAYANACEATHPDLARDLREKLGAAPAPAAQAGADAIGYINERTLSVLKAGTVSCTHISPVKTEYAQVPLYMGAK